MSELVRPSHTVGLTLLSQPDYWLTKADDGRLTPIALYDMSDNHRARLLDWLRLNAVVMHSHERRAIASMWRSGVITDEEFGARLRHLEATPPPVWLDDTALVRRLVQLVPREPAAPKRHRRLGGLLRRTAR